MSVAQDDQIFGIRIKTTLSGESIEYIMLEFRARNRAEEKARAKKASEIAIGYFKKGKKQKGDVFYD